MAAKTEGDNIFRRRGVLSRGDDLHGEQLSLFGMGSWQESNARKRAGTMGERSQGERWTESGRAEERLSSASGVEQPDKLGGSSGDLSPIRKVYDPDLDKNVGEPGEAAVGAHLWRLEGVSVVEHWPFGKYDVDFRVVRWGDEFFVDAELRRNWPAGMDRFPPYFKTIHIPFRKKGMIETRQPFVYYSVRADAKIAAVIHGEAILDAGVVGRHENVLVPDGDTFFDVPSDWIVGYEEL